MAAQTPSDLRYAKSHEWARTEGELVTVGITDFAQSELGDVVYVDLPEVGRVLQKGETFGTVESVKTVSDLYAPVGGEVIAVNPRLKAASELVNSDPYGEGHLLVIRATDSAEDLLDADAYAATVG